MTDRSTLLPHVVTNSYLCYGFDLNGPPKAKAAKVQSPKLSVQGWWLREVMGS